MNVKEYEEFLVWSDEQGLDFPCTANQFSARVAAFLGDRWNAADHDALMTQGVGPNWAE